MLICTELWYLYRAASAAAVTDDYRSISDLLLTGCDVIRSADPSPHHSAISSPHQHTSNIDIHIQVN